MAVVTTKSTIISNRDATPPVLNNPGLSGGYVKEAHGFCSSVSGDSIASKYIFTQIPSNARVSSVRLSSGALGGSAAADIGIYQTTQNGGAVVDADFFASAVTLVSAQTNTEVLNESAINTVAKQGQMLWQALGLTEDPGINYDIVATLTAASAGSVDLSIKAQYSIGS